MAERKQQGGRGGRGRGFTGNGPRGNGFNHSQGHNGGNFRRNNGNEQFNRRQPEVHHAAQVPQTAQPPAVQRMPQYNQSHTGANFRHNNGNEQFHHRQPISQPTEHVPQMAVQRMPQPASIAGQGRGGMRNNRMIPEIVRTRPIDCVTSKQGTAGTQIMLQSNYFKVSRKDEECIFQYRVDVNPPTESSRLLCSVVSNLKPIVGAYIFDGTILITRHKLRNEEAEITTKESRTGQEYVVKLRKVGVVDFTNEVAFQVLNLINRKAMAGLKLQLIGRNFFDPNGKISINQFGLEVFPGYLTSIRQHEQDILMCADVTHKVLRMDTCYTLLKQCSTGYGNWKDNFKRMVLGTVVMATYGSNKTYTINDVEFNTTVGNASFDTPKGKISLLQYYQDRYNITIRDPQQPILVTRSKGRDIRAGMPELVYLVPELVRATGLTDDMRKNFNLTRALAEHTRLTPDRRIARLEMFNRRLQETQDSSDVFQFWKTELDRRLVEIPARIIKPEMLEFGGNSTPVVPDVSAEWQSAFRNNQMFLSIALTSWYVIVPSGQERLCGQFLDSLVQASRGMRFEVAAPRMEVIPNDSPNVYAERLGQIVQRDPQLIMCLVTNDRADRYSAIKRRCCVDRGVPTQVLKLRTITPKGGNVRTLLSVATKVAIQLNCKLGGIPWLMKGRPPMSIMVLGYDVCHDTRDRTKSFGALVATNYHNLVNHPKFFSTVNHHSRGEELSNYMSQNVIKAIHSYRQDFGGALPDQIILYRDGVGDGQLQYVYEHEVGAIRAKLQQTCKDRPAPKFTFFVVSKRINTRLFQNKQNPPPGTIVDDVITLPERNDFFLVSQSVRQGTVSPTSYNILHDETGFGPDRLQRFSYQQTHLYYNWSGTVAVPAVCQYAHKLAALAGQCLHQAPNSVLEKKLYYL